MPSLAQILAHHGRILVLDAASTRIQVGLLQAGATPQWRFADEEAGRALFTETEGLLRATGLKLADIGAFVHCEGPGSMLGIRTAAMALRTWLTEKPRPVYAYSSLTLLAWGLADAGQAAPFTVIADARRDTWHAVTVDAGGPREMRRVPSAEIATSVEPLFQPASFRAWSPAPRPTIDCAYAVDYLFSTQAGRELLRPTPLPEVFQHEAPEYKKWSAQVHSAVTAPSR